MEKSPPLINNASIIKIQNRYEKFPIRFLDNGFDGEKNLGEKTPQS